jgi:hypothetical protein
VRKFISTAADACDLAKSKSTQKLVRNMTGKGGVAGKKESNRDLRKFCEKERKRIDPWFSIWINGWLF